MANSLKLYEVQLFSILPN